MALDLNHSQLTHTSKMQKREKTDINRNNRPTWQCDDGRLTSSDRADKQQADHSSWQQSKCAAIYKSICHSNHPVKTLKNWPLYVYSLSTYVLHRCLVTSPPRKLNDRRAIDALGDMIAVKLSFDGADVKPVLLFRNGRPAHSYKTTWPRVNFPWKIHAVIAVRLLSRCWFSYPLHRNVLIAITSSPTDWILL